MPHESETPCCFDDLFAAGLRLSEATHLKVADIDGDRKQLNIRSGKGRKARVVPASPRLLTALRDYWKLRRPADFLFPGKILKGHVYRCDDCQSSINVYNSCGDRHCPQCSGARRADWMDKSAEVIVPGVNYFQVIFTLPDKLSALILGNRTELYSLLFQSAWKALGGELRRTGKFHPAALMVLHT